MGKCMPPNYLQDVAGRRRDGIRLRFDIKHLFAFFHERYTEIGVVLGIERFHHLVCCMQPCLS